MKVISAKEAKNSFGQLIDHALVEPVAVTKHGRPVVVVMRFEEFERLVKDAPAGGMKPLTPARG